MLGTNLLSYGKTVTRPNFYLASPSSHDESGSLQLQFSKNNIPPRKAIILNCRMWSEAARADLKTVGRRSVHDWKLARFRNRDSHFARLSDGNTALIGSRYLKANSASPFLRVQSNAENCGARKPWRDDAPRERDVPRARITTRREP